MWHRKVLNSLLLGCSLALLAGPCSGKELAGEVRWSGKVTLDESLMLTRDAVLTILPGTQVDIANSQVKISVQGQIKVEGTAAAPVVFAGARGWQGIEFMEAPAGSEIRWAKFSASAAAISSFATDFRVENCTFADNEFGVKLLRESNPVIIDSSFDNNLVGISNEMKSGAEIRGNRFSGHSRSAILASHGSKGSIADNVFTKNKHGITLLQHYPDRISNNTFIENEIAIYCNQTKSTPVIEGNLFDKNGHGVLNFSFSYPVIRNNRFIGNTTALQNDQYGSPLVEHNLFRGNETALYNYRKSNPNVHLNSFEQNGLLLYCDFSSYPVVKENNFLGNGMGVKLGIYQSADWERRSGSKAIMQREAASRESQNPMLAKAPEIFADFVDVSGNWWGDDTAQLVEAGETGNSPLFYDRHDKPEVTYEDYGPGVYKLDRVHFSPWLKQAVSNAGIMEKK